jgi:hypothetical protein
MKINTHLILDQLFLPINYLVKSFVIANSNIACLEEPIFCDRALRGGGIIQVSL